MSRHRWFASLVLLASIALARPSVAQSRGFEPNDLYRMRSVGDVQMSPDGSQIVYTVIHHDRSGRPYSQAWLWDVASGAASRLGESSFSGPRWSPDGQWIAFFGSEAERPGLRLTETAPGSC